MKRYFEEQGSDAVRTMLETATDQHFILRLAIAEVTSAIVRRAMPDVSTRQLTEFNTDMSNNLHMRPLNDELIDDAVLLIQQHRLRGCDSLQLAAALNLADELHQIAIDLELDEAEAELTFVCADDLLNTAATAEGLTVINPNTL
ncbi:MAG: type II toxin-antitoxin system VapC family toxin [Anaerolineae bacterium]|nr:type II toxin-antitoxin system VapC family toxin [Anaerolineae bacterium]